PFGDFLPIRQLSVGAIDLSAGPGPQTITLPGLSGFAPLVCYEAIFPAAAIDEANRPAWILNVTNDAWYGRSSGPFQHFAIARTPRSSLNPALTGVACAATLRGDLPFKVVRRD